MRLKPGGSNKSRDERVPVEDPSEVAEFSYMPSAEEKALMSQDELSERIAMEIVHRKLKGETTAQIARALGVSNNAIHVRLEKIREFRKRVVKDFNDKIYVGRELESYEVLEQRLWRALENVKKPKDEIAATKALLLLHKDRSRLLQVAGLLKVAPKEVHVEVSQKGPGIDTWNEAQRARISEAIVDANIMDAQIIPEEPPVPEQKKLPPKSSDDVSLDDLADFLREVDDET